MTEEQNIGSWLKAEAEKLGTQTEYEKKPSMKFEENKLTEIEVDFSEPFQKWTGTGKGNTKEVTKAIIPVWHDGIQKNFWLNVRNPLFRELIMLGKAGQTKFKIMQTGTQASTKYILVK